jgi:hypothetical protein
MRLWWSGVSTSDQFHQDHRSVSRKMREAALESRNLSVGVSILGRVVDVFLIITLTK